jgi:acyl dehydratase
MPLSSEVVGLSGEPVVHDVDARWTMAYAAGLGDYRDEYLDTRARGDVLAHPLFPVCFEWPIFLNPRHLPATPDLSVGERLRGVHATHDLELHRPLRAGLRVETRATVVRVEARAPGAYQRVRLDSVDGEGEPVCTTWYGTLMRGVEVLGEDRACEENERRLPPMPESEPTAELEITVARNDAHVYTECARIWNPIHTDPAIATGAGLPGIILHGTATLALAVSRIIDQGFAGETGAVARIAARFAGMVAIPSTLNLRIFESDQGAIRFSVLDERGKPVIRDGLVGRRG